MKLAETLQAKLSSLHPLPPGRHAISETLGDTGWTLHLDATQVESLGSQLSELTLTRSSTAWENSAAMKAHADRLVERVAGLREPLRLIELDTVRHEALLRSESPHRRGEAISYYEIRMVAATNQISFRRFTIAPKDGAKREQTPFALTHEVLAALVEDIVLGLK